MLQVSVTQDSGYTTYKFIDRQTSYEVLTEDEKEFTVYSKRLNYSGFPGIKVYGSLEEMAKRGKVFKNLVDLISEEGNKA